MMHEDLWVDAPIDHSAEPVASLDLDLWPFLDALYRYEKGMVKALKVPMIGYNLWHRRLSTMKNIQTYISREKIPALASFLPSLATKTKCQTQVTQPPLQPPEFATCRIILDQ